MIPDEERNRFADEDTLTPEEWEVITDERTEE